MFTEWADAPEWLMAAATKLQVCGVISFDADKVMFPLDTQVDFSIYRNRIYG